MRGRNSPIHLCDFSVGRYRVRSPSGKQTINFEDSDRFGPAKVEMRTGNLSPISERSWFWAFYTPWLEAGRPVKGQPKGTPFGPLLTAEPVSGRSNATSPQTVNSSPGCTTPSPSEEVPGG